MNDLETGQSWLHDDKFTSCHKQNRAAFERAVQQEGENIGKQWYIVGKWTSFIAVDTGSRIENIIRLYRAERSELADLTKSRNNGVTLAYAGMSARKSSSLFIPTLPGARDDKTCQIDSYDWRGGTRAKHRQAEAAGAAYGAPKATGRCRSRIRDRRRSTSSSPEPNERRYRRHREDRSCSGGRDAAALSARIEVAAEIELERKQPRGEKAGKRKLHC